ELLPLESYFLRSPGEPVPRQIDEVELSVDTIKIRQLRTAWFRTRKGQPLLASQAIQQTRLTDITASQKCNFGKRLGRKLARPGCTDYKFGVHQAPDSTATNSLLCLMRNSFFRGPHQIRRRGIRRQRQGDNLAL